jgi:hypothetical protein
MTPLLTAVLLVAVGAGFIFLVGALLYGGGFGTVLLWPEHGEGES